MIIKWLIKLLYILHNIDVDENVSESITEDSNTVSGKFITIISGKMMYIIKSIKFVHIYSNIVTTNKFNNFLWHTQNWLSFIRNNKTLEIISIVIKFMLFPKNY